MLEKKISIWYLIASAISILFFTILFGSFLVHYYEYGPRYPKLQKTAIFVASIPINLEKLLRYGTSLTPMNRNSSDKLTKNKDDKYNKFYHHKKNKRKALLVLPRYVNEEKRSVVEIIDLENFNIIHRYNHNIEDTYKENRKRYQYGHPLILKDGSMLAKNVMPTPLFKIDLCGKNLWKNEQLTKTFSHRISFHHSLELDHEDNVWVSGTLNEWNQSIYEHQSIERPGDEKGQGFADDAIIKINPKTGSVIFVKSVIAILLENNIFTDSDIYTTSDPIHINDVQPVMSSGPYWKVGDVFISILRKSSIIHYRPETNKVINYIKGPFFEQHDVDIYSKDEITIFNNNNTINKDSAYSEILIYNFQNKKFRKILDKELEMKNFKTKTEGLADFLADGSIMTEETNGGRILFYNAKGELEWEFLNIANDGNIYPISWSRIISDANHVKSLKESINNKQC